MNNEPTIQDALADMSKKKRGRPKGSKNKPKLSEEQNIEQLRPVKEASRPKSSRKAAKRPSDFLFIIKPKPGAKCYYQTEVTVDYTPSRELDQIKSIVPKLNTDNLPYIPGFIMQMDETYYHKHENRYKEDHRNKIIDYAHPKKGLYQPKPGKRHNYCCVCKQQYDDYLSHVNSPTHKKLYNANEFAKYIKSLSGQYNQWSRQPIKEDLIEYFPETQTNVENQQEDCQIIPADSSNTQKCLGLKEKVVCDAIIPPQQQQQFLRAPTSFQQYPNAMYRQTQYMDIATGIRPQIPPPQSHQQQQQQQQQQFLAQKVPSLSSNNSNNGVLVPPSLPHNKQQPPMNHPAPMYYEPQQQQYAQQQGMMAQHYNQPQMQPGQPIYFQPSNQYFLNLTGSMMPQQNMNEPQQQQQQQDMHGSGEVHMHHNQLGYQQQQQQQQQQQPQQLHLQQQQQQQQSLNGKRKAETCVYYNPTLENPRKVSAYPITQGGMHHPGHLGAPQQQPQQQQQLQQQQQQQQEKLLTLSEDQQLHLGVHSVGHPAHPGGEHLLAATDNLFMLANSPFVQ